MDAAAFVRLPLRRVHPPSLGSGFGCFGGSVIPELFIDDAGADFRVDMSSIRRTQDKKVKRGGDEICGFHGLNESLFPALEIKLKKKRA